VTQPGDSNADRMEIVARVAERLAWWGITGVFGDFRGAQVEQTMRIDRGAPGRPPTEHEQVTIIKQRPSFTVECLDCGPSPHVTPDDAAIAVCLRCGRDRWL
jgi:hypothetical protein